MTNNNSQSIHGLKPRAIQLGVTTVAMSIPIITFLIFRDSNMGKKFTAAITRRRTKMKVGR